MSLSNEIKEARKRVEVKREIRTSLASLTYSTSGIPHTIPGTADRDRVLRDAIHYCEIIKSNCEKLKTL